MRCDKCLLHDNVCECSRGGRGLRWQAGNRACSSLPASYRAYELYVPEMNGAEAARIMKKSWQEIAIIGISMASDTFISDCFP